MIKWVRECRRNEADTETKETITISFEKIYKVPLTVVKIEGGHSRAVICIFLIAVSVPLLDANISPNVPFWVHTQPRPSATVYTTVITNEKHSVNKHLPAKGPEIVGHRYIYTPTLYSRSIKRTHFFIAEVVCRFCAANWKCNGTHLLITRQNLFSDNKTKRPNVWKWDNN